MKKLFTLILFCLACTFISCEDEFNFDYSNPCTTVHGGGVTISTSVSSPDYVGGCSVFYSIQNYSGKVIKYVKISTVFLDTYNKNIKCEVTGRDWIDCTITGPIYETYSCSCSRKFYNYAARKAHITNCLVTFEDGSEVKLNK